MTAIEFRVKYNVRSVHECCANCILSAAKADDVWVCKHPLVKDAKEPLYVQSFDVCKEHLDAEGVF